ncbi:MAG: GTPase Era [Betaproteobacteria bacterium]|nr:GTPase Era [Betaproteobacteria bacterium]MDH5285127.1 GTPase Era [Betaproteobacteria bacterium]
MSADGAAPFRCGHVAIVGRPSVGKSTLLNRLVGAKVSITSKRPQTTRHRITGILSEPGRQFVFVDTPGFQTKHRSRLNARLNKSVREALGEVDVVVWVVDGERIVDADRAVLALVPSRVPVVVAVNKVDALADKSALLPRLAGIAALREFAAIVPVSAEKGTQLAALRDEIAKALPEGPPLYPEDDLTDRDERFLAAEYVREKIFRLLGDEVPYAATVGIDKFEHEGALRRIFASVYVEKASQRAILLGEGGKRMKAIASTARRDLERLLGGPVYLEVWVRVKKGWTGDDGALDRMGY